jgi:hypothetical protein
VKTLLVRALSAGLLAGALVAPGGSAQALPGDTLAPLVWSGQQPGLTATVALVRGTRTPRALRFTVRNTSTRWWGLGAGYTAFAAGSPDPVDINGGLLGWVPPNGSLVADAPVFTAAMPRLRIVPSLLVDLTTKPVVQAAQASATLVSVTPIIGGKRVVFALANKTAVARDLFGDGVLAVTGTRRGVIPLELLNGDLPVPPHGTRRVTVDLVDPRIAALPGTLSLLVGRLTTTRAFAPGLTATAPVVAPQVGSDLLQIDTTVSSTRATATDVNVYVALFRPDGSLVEVEQLFAPGVPAGGSLPVEGFALNLPPGTVLAGLTGKVVRLLVV